MSNPSKQILHKTKTVNNTFDCHCDELIHRLMCIQFNLSAITVTTTLCTVLLYCIEVNCVDLGWTKFKTKTVTRRPTIFSDRTEWINNNIIGSVGDYPLHFNKYQIQTIFSCTVVTVHRSFVTICVTWNIYFLDPNRILFCLWFFFLSDLECGDFFFLRYSFMQIMHQNWR